MPTNEPATAPREGFLLQGDRRIHYLEWGDPKSPPLVMLHGFSSSARGTWDDTAPRFAERWHVYAFDHRGHGESDWDPEAAYTLANYVADFEEAVRQLAIPPFLLIGHSMGGAISITYTAKNPAMVRKLIVVDAGAQEPGGMRRATNFNQRPLKFASRSEAEAYARKQMPEEDRNRKLGYGFVEHPDGSVGWRADVGGLIRHREGPIDDIRKTGLWPQIGALACPTLIFRAGQSPSVHPDNARRMMEVNPRIRVVEYENARHWLHQDEPERFFEDAIRFFDEG